MILDVILGSLTGASVAVLWIIVTRGRPFG